MNLYNLHSNPEELHGFDIAPYKLPDLAYELAKKNPELRPKLEPVIMKDPRSAYYYVKDVRERRWPEAEPYIMKDAMRAYMYARHILKRRWPEAEPYIMKDNSSWNWWSYYKRHFNL